MSLLTSIRYRYRVTVMEDHCYLEHKPGIFSRWFVMRYYAGANAYTDAHEKAFQLRVQEYNR